MAALYVAAGFWHFVHPAFYKAIMPPWLLYHYPLIYITGAAEVILGILLLPLITRKQAAWGIIILLIVIYPANIQMLINFLHEHNAYTWAAVLRLPLQFLLIWWAWIYTKSKSRNYYCRVKNKTHK